VSYVPTQTPNKLPRILKRCKKQTPSLFICVEVKIKFMFALEQATMAQIGSSGIALLFLLPRRWMGWVVKATPRPLYPEKDPVLIV
jgi:hypothetical protein